MFDDALFPSNVPAAGRSGPGGAGLSPAGRAETVSGSRLPLGHELRALRRLIRAAGAAAPHKLDPHAALSALVEATGAQAGSIWLIEADGAVRRAAQVGLSAEYMAQHGVFLGAGPLQRELVCSPEVQVLRDDVSGRYADPHRSLHQLIGVKTMAVLPLRVHERSVGAALLGHADPQWFQQFSLDFLHSASELVAVSLDRADDTEGRRTTQMLAHLELGVALVAGADGRVLDHNPAFAALTTVTGEDGAAGRRLDELFPGDRGEKLTTWARDAVTRAQTCRGAELVGAADEGDSRVWLVSVTPIATGDATDPERAVVAISDVTERRVSEEQLRHADKMEAVGTLAGGIAHEYNNLLTAILGNVSLALLDLPPTHPLVPGLRDSEGAALRAAELTRQLLGFGRRSPAHLRRVQLSEVIDEALARTEHRLPAGVQVVRDVSGSAGSVLADGDQLVQVIANLCQNALDAMPQGGVLTVREVHAAKLAEGGVRAAEFTGIEIQDTGGGIEPALMARIYEPFFTTKGPDGGTGLGLAMVHAIIDQHGGWIECESAPGLGTTFRVLLPSGRPAASATSSNASRGETVLVVDDEATLRGLAKSVLERLGYRVLLARDGYEALQWVSQGVKADLVLLDQTMPRLSGGETLRRLRERVPGIRVVLTSGYALGARPSGLEGLDVQGFLPKPYSPDRLGLAVRAALDLPR